MLTIKRVNKTFDSNRVTNNVSFDVNSGNTLGIIGQNGSGKTTIFRMILGFLKQDSGEIHWSNPLSKNEFFNSVGYLPEERGLNLKRSVEEQIMFFGKLKGMSDIEMNESIKYWFEKFEVTVSKKQKIKSLSKGNQQKVQLICSLIHKPTFLILDEPFSGLDPINSELLINGILELKKKGTTIIFSSHNMNNVEKICDDLIMLNKGTVVLNGKIDTIRESFGRTNILIESSIASDTLKNLDGVLSIENFKQNIRMIKVKEPIIGKQIFDIVSSDGYVSMFSQQPPSLEEIFKLKVGETIE